MPVLPWYLLIISDLDSRSTNYIYNKLMALYVKLMENVDATETSLIRTKLGPTWCGWIKPLCIHIHMHICIYLYIIIYIYIWVCNYILYTYIHVCIYAYVCWYVHMICVYLWCVNIWYVYICVHFNVYIHCIYIYIYTVFALLCKQPFSHVQDWRTGLVSTRLIHVSPLHSIISWDVGILTLNVYWPLMHIYIYIIYMYI